MASFTHLLVGLDFSAADAQLFQYLRFWNQHFSPEKVFLLHVSPELEVPVFARELYQETRPIPMDERIRSLMEEDVRTQLSGTELDIEYLVAEGAATEQLLHWANIKQVSLTLVGQKEAQLASGLAARRFLRKSRSSVLFVPAETAPNLQKILLPTDFSKDSSTALLRVLEMARSLPKAPQIELLHVYDVPSHVHFQLMRTQAAFGEMMHANVKSYCEDYLRDFPIGDLALKTVFLENTYSNTAQHIADYARQSDADWIVVGAQGHSAMASFFIGSVTEKLLSMRMSNPFMVIRTP